MIQSIQIPVKRTAQSRLAGVSKADLEFGSYVSDHMFLCDFDQDHPVSPGWQLPSIVPYQELRLDPAALALHYGQTVFEGMKAFRREDGSIGIFRLEKHYERFVRSLKRMCMAVPPPELFRAALRQLVAVDRQWVPTRPGQALYLRPFIYASEARFGVKVSSRYRFIVITGPVPELYSRSIRVKVETDYIRAAKGGTGFAKCGGNYGAAFYPTQVAREEGYDQVLWTDAVNHEFIEESGMMNVMFVINGRLVTPPLSDSILDGVTRDSLLKLCGMLGLEAEERKVSLDELERGITSGSLTEAFGAGTAAVVAPISVIHFRGREHVLPVSPVESIASRLKNKLEAIRTGREGDPFGWIEIIR